MNKLFESKNYPTIMYLLIIIMSMLILFNFVNLSNQKTNQENKLTNLAIQESIEKINESKADIFYYFILGFQFISILIILNKLSKK